PPQVEADRREDPHRDRGGPAARRSRVLRRLPRLRRRDRAGPPRGAYLDPRVHRLQGEAEGVTSPTSTTPLPGAPSAPTQRALLQDAYRDRLALLNHHVDGATRIAGDEFYKTYQ